MGNGVPAEAASGPGRQTAGTESVAANLNRLEGALKRLSWVATMRIAPARSARAPADAPPKGGAPDDLLAERDRLAAALASLQEDHDRLLQDHARLQESHAELDRQRQDLGDRLEAAIDRLRDLIPDSE